MTLRQHLETIRDATTGLARQHALAALADLDAARTHMIFGNGEYLSTMRFIPDPAPTLTITDRARAYLSAQDADS